MIADENTIQKAVDFIREKVSPEKIYLFGSYAKGMPNRNSDLDFFIIKETKEQRIKRAIPLYSTDKTKKIGIPIGIDFIIYTPREYEAAKKEANSIVGEVMRTGRLVYERNA